MSKKQTALNWLEEMINKMEAHEADLPALRIHIEQAKEIEKQQVMESYDIGFNDGCSYMFDGKTEYNDLEGYYTETYGGQTMSNKKETPVRWLVEQLKINKYISENSHWLIDEALQMESKKQQKYDEMLAMLEQAERTLREVFDCDTEKALQLIKEAKEL